METALLDGFLLQVGAQRATAAGAGLIERSVVQSSCLELCSLLATELDLEAGVLHFLSSLLE